MIKVFSLWHVNKDFVVFLVLGKWYLRVPIYCILVLLLGLIVVQTNK